MRIDLKKLDKRALSAEEREQIDAEIVDGWLNASRIVLGGGNRRAVVRLIDDALAIVQGKPPHELLRVHRALLRGLAIAGNPAPDAELDVEPRVFGACLRWAGVQMIGADDGTAIVCVRGRVIDGTVAQRAPCSTCGSIA